MYRGKAPKVVCAYRVLSADISALLRQADYRGEAQKVVYICRSITFECIDGSSSRERMEGELNGTDNCAERDLSEM